MQHLPSEPGLKSRRRRIGPVLIAVLFFLAACGISVDFLLEQLAVHRSAATDRATDRALEASGVVAKSPAESTAVSIPVSMPESTPESTPDSGAITTATPVDPFADDISMAGPDLPIEKSGANLPFSKAWPNESRRPGAVSGAVPGADRGVDPADEPFEMARGKVRAPAQFEYETPPEELKISTDPSRWKGVPQLLPSPMYVSELIERRSLDVRGGGWVIIDVNRSQITNVELYKSVAKSAFERRVIEAKYVDGRTVVNPNSAGFAIARGVPGLQPGGFEVFENPPCMTRFSNVSEEEVCEVTVRGNKARFKFSPPVLAVDRPAPDFTFSDVFYDAGKLGWKRIITFNESFHPLGDPNRDGYPDFIVESVTGYDESGVHVLLMSNVRDEIVDYVPYTARFKGH